MIPLKKVPAMAKALEGRSGFETENYNGKSALTVYMPIVLQPDEPGSPADWGLVAKIDADEAFAPISNFRDWFFTLQAGLLAAGGIASYGMSRRLTRPIRQLTLQATRASGGELSVRVPTSGLDELGVLATTFNSMIERLAESRELLETRVVERTRELARTNAELAQEIVIRREAEEALHVGQRRIHAILEATHEAFIGIDGKSIVTDWNHQAEFTFGWSREEAVGRSVPELIIPERSRERHYAGLRQFLETGFGPVLNHRLELIALHRDGARISRGSDRVGLACRRWRVFLSMLFYTTSHSARKQNGCCVKARNDSECWSMESRTMQFCDSTRKDTCKAGIPVPSGFTVTRPAK